MDATQKYRVKVKAIIVQTFDIDADSEEDAMMQANELFNPGDVATDEQYDQQAEIITGG